MPPVIYVVFSIIVIAALIGVVFLIRHLANKKYNEFVLQYSVCLKQLNEINIQYKFYPFINFDQSCTYDNEKLYDNVSCKDYLIYQLQYIKKQVCAQIDNISINRKQYAEYLAKVNSISQSGQFTASIGKLKLSKLLQKEAELIKKQTISAPITLFTLKVTLRRSDLNGTVFNGKSETFSERDIFTLIKRLDNKYGDFYNDREIWDAICRVERAKVSNKLRFSIYARDGYKCCNCGIADDGTNLEIDHIIPISKGGKSTCDNLQTLCHKCNIEKGDTHIKYR